MQISPSLLDRTFPSLLIDCPYKGGFMIINYPLYNFMAIIIILFFYRSTCCHAHTWWTYKKRSLLISSDHARIDFSPCKEQKKI